MSSRFKIPFLILWFGILSALSCQNPSPPAAPPPPKTPQNWTVQIIAAPNNTFGYDVFADGNILIHQPQVPALPGNEGFKTREQAQRVGDFVIQKLKKGEMPPTVTTEEMKELGVF